MGKFAFLRLLRIMDVLRYSGKSLKLFVNNPRLWELLEKNCIKSTSLESLLKVFVKILRQIEDLKKFDLKNVFEIILTKFLKIYFFKNSIP